MPSAPQNAQDVVRKAEELGPRLAATAEQSERDATLAPDAVAALREIGVIRMLQPVEHGGMQSHPADFAQAVMTVARSCGSAGWVAGVVGMHPWELAQFDQQLRQEVWGENPDAWIASPYMPSGIAVPTDGGYRLSGNWQFSSGTDHCDWVVIGALLGGETGRPIHPAKSLHLVVPRPDYVIDQESWNVIGLSGTGSKNICVQGAFVPEHRVVPAGPITEGTLGTRPETLYRLPFWTIFPLGITSAVIGIAEGALASHIEYQRGRVSATGARMREDPHALYAVSEAAAEIHASRVQLLDGVNRLFDSVDAGNEVTFEQRATLRRNQIRCAWRAVTAVDQIFARSGGNALRKDNPLQRFWRDAHAGLNHATHLPSGPYQAAAMDSFGQPVEGHMRVTI